MAITNKFLNADAVSGYVIDLRAAGSTGPYNQVGYLKLRAIPGAAASIFLVRPVVVAPGDTAPSAPGASPTPASGQSADWVYLKSDTLNTIELGVPWSKGYSPDVHGAPLATHLLVWCAVIGFLSVTGE